MASTRARKTDPETSHEAADRLTEDMLTAAQARVLRMFHLYGNMPDAKLVKYLNEMERSAGLKPMSPSGVRSRRSELAKPNMERMAAIEKQIIDEAGLFGADAPNNAIAKFQIDEQVRLRLRAEGFRSPLWDTGLRVKLDGSNVIVWGLAHV